MSETATGRDAIKLALGDELKRARLRAGLTQTAAAVAVGKSRSAVCNWERGEDEPTAVDLLLLARAYAVQLDQVAAVVRRLATRESRRMVLVAEAS